MMGHANSGSEADRIWQMMVGLVWETRGEWRRKVSDATGLGSGQDTPMMS